MDLVEFLNARLDEDARTAKAAGHAKPEEWHADPDPEVWGPGAGTAVLRPDNGPLAMAIGSYAADHIARHDPARVLREVEAKRAILADYADSLKADFGITGEPFDGGYNTGLERAVKHLAAAWSDHPDYQQDWHA